MSKENYTLKNKNLMPRSNDKLRIDNYLPGNIYDNFFTCLEEPVAKFLIHKYEKSTKVDEIKQLDYLNDLINQRELKSSMINSINEKINNRLFTHPWKLELFRRNKKRNITEEKSRE
ncbi:MAG: hypothetical protein QF567_01205 [Candidatus Pacearchaeota archaeon]|jgi:hypothetical protein|nr:hypothetical protein [Candidatus Pacearchaeota archaeon]MDP7520832.1 hypothetical protein [Candidatus Pacearchaeota archaeon]|tara:strand:+ start:3547 stop:3897 length:351 start_codon:yes stop_codon:yes gene_type:complete